MKVQKNRAAKREGGRDLEDGSRGGFLYGDGVS